MWVLLSNPEPRKQVKPLGRMEATDIGLKGLNIRQKTDYTDEKFTWMDLTSSEGHNIEGRPGTHMLYDVRVQVVVEKQKPVKSATEEGGLPVGGIADLQTDLDIAWFLIRADRGIYSFNTRNIELDGNAQVFGYSRTGEIREWISADRIVYDWEHGQIRSDGYAIYQGQAFNRGRPCSGVFSAGLDLSEANISNWRHLEPDYRTPFNDPSLLPPYDPPEALNPPEKEKGSGV